MNINRTLSVSLLSFNMATGCFAGAGRSGSASFPLLLPSRNSIRLDDLGPGAKSFVSQLAGLSPIAIDPINTQPFEVTSPSLGAVKVLMHHVNDSGPYKAISFETAQLIAQGLKDEESFQAIQQGLKHIPDPYPLNHWMNGLFVQMQKDPEKSKYLGAIASRLDRDSLTLAVGALFDNRAAEAADYVLEGSVGGVGVSPRALRDLKNSVNPQVTTYYNSGRTWNVLLDISQDRFLVNRFPLMGQRLLLATELIAIGHATGYQRRDDSMKTESLLHAIRISLAEQLNRWPSITEIESRCRDILAGRYRWPGT